MYKTIIPIFTIFILAIFFVGCEDDDSNVNNSNNGGNQLQGIQFTPGDRPVFSLNKEYKVLIKGGRSPYSITSTDIPSAYISNDTLRLINQSDSTPTLYGINIEDANQLSAQFQFISSPESISMDIPSNSFPGFSATARDNSDTIGCVFVLSSMIYTPENDRLRFTSGQLTAHSDLVFSVEGVKEGNLKVNSFTFKENPPPIKYATFWGSKEVDRSADQSFEITYDEFKIPNSFSFKMVLQDRDTTSMKMELLTQSDVELTY